MAEKHAPAAMQNAATITADPAAAATTTTAATAMLNSNRSTMAWRIGRTDGHSCDASQGCSSSPYTHDMHVCCGSAAPADICYTATDLAHTAQHTHATHHML